MILRIAKEGYLFILLSLFIGIAGLRFSSAVGVVFIALAIFIAFFFRDPVRVPPDQKNCIVSPADGRVLSITEVSEDIYLKRKATKISIFLSIFNVHMNYAPIEGDVEYVQYNKGKFKMAFVDKASDLNENNAVGIKGAGTSVLVRQIAGLIARRIVCYLKPGDHAGFGKKFGLIRFGSRVDIYIDTKYKVNVKIGDRVMGGVTVLAQRP